ncbi:MAG: Tim44-like domain protein [uncultured Sphingomonadaceae bacterium]|uniref:Tim44-like domain protein n=1 Tax=uncultured Sphingomonadaceae bacterium TaxID=169976 RepID=A0A6J4SD52_9SPHN|nr:MAG: Tim44-like domain protein [uncultured Sphingomonadaceae bacterium]
MITIIIMAMIAVFVGLRLYQVLGERTGHEQQPIARPTETRVDMRKVAPVDEVIENEPARSNVFEPAAADGVRAIIGADQSFDVGQFLEGAQGAYRMILEAFWRGDEATLEPLVDTDVREAFFAAIAQRKAAGHLLDNRLIAIENAIIERATLNGRNAVVAVRFDAVIAAITRDADGHVVAGTLSDAVQTHEVWTFGRNLDAVDPNWLLIETDDVA